MKLGFQQASFFRRALTGISLLVILTGGPVATSVGNSADDLISDPELLWPLSINIPYHIVHLIQPDDIATVILRIDVDGKMIDWVSLNLPHYDLVGALDEALSYAEFSPAMENGEALAMDIVVTIPVGEVGYYGVFSMTPMTYIETRLSTINGRLNELSMCMPHELDEPLELVETGTPVAYKDISGKRVTGSVEVEFYVDQNGRPRIIRTEQGADTFLREAAYLTVQQFRFAPPAFNGNQTIVRGRMDLQF